MSDQGTLTHLEMFEDPLEKEEEKTVPHHINDSEARDLLRKLCSDSNICAIQTFQRKERNSILESALSRGLGVRQLARLTGVSYGIIQRINEKVGQSPLTHLKTGTHTQVSVLEIPMTISKVTKNASRSSFLTRKRPVFSQTFCTFAREYST